MRLRERSSSLEEESFTLLDEDRLFLFFLPEDLSVRRLILKGPAAMNLKLLKSKLSRTVRLAFRRLERNRCCF